MILIEWTTGLIYYSSFVISRLNLKRSNHNDVIASVLIATAIVTTPILLQLKSAYALVSEEIAESKTAKKAIAHADTSGNYLSAARSGDEIRTNPSSDTDPIPANMNNTEALVTSGFRKAPAYLIDHQHHIDMIYGSIDNYLKHLGGGARTESAVHAYQKAADLESSQESHRIEAESQKIHK